MLVSQGSCATDSSAQWLHHSTGSALNVLKVSYGSTIRCIQLTSRATHPSQPFFECTFCRIRVCPSCIARHPQSHNRCIVRLQKVPLNEAFNSAQTCITCGDTVTLRYSCQQCYFAQCRPCWHAGGVTRHEHKAMNLFEVREDYQGKHVQT